MFSLVADYETTSSSSSSDDESYSDETESLKARSSSTTLKPPPALLLPSANVLLNRESSKPIGDVFNNPFLEAEKLEIDKLQQHVKMVESENHLLQKNGRKICWNNRKGRCRFGNKCKYAHDSDLVEPKDIPDAKDQVLNKKLKSSTTIGNTMCSEDDSDSKEKINHRKRPGLGDCIVPGKRVMKTYHNLKKTT